MTRSSGTSSPASMIARTFPPSSLPDATAARSMPVFFVEVGGGRRRVKDGGGEEKGKKEHHPHEKRVEGRRAWGQPRRNILQPFRALAGGEIGDRERKKQQRAREDRRYHAR